MTCEVDCSSTAGVPQSPSELLLLDRFPVCLHGFHEAQPAVLDALFGLRQLLLGLLVLLLQRLNEGFVLLAGSRDLLVFRLDLLLQGSPGHCQKLLYLFLLVGITEVQVCRATPWAKVVLRELLQLRELAAAFVVLQVGGVTVLDGWEALHAHFVAHGLAFTDAIDICNQDRLMTGIFLHELVPVLLHGLAVTTPGRKELHEDALAGRLLIPRLLREFDGADGREQGEKKHGLHGRNSHRKPWDCLETTEA
mmetsp:Transcript_133132/g.188085  ORF Transcript_133132/g.188085 Transcript_133132/m.188085 type:complete len:251 (+) Transcript_133132:285-1037(+)